MVKDNRTVIGSYSNQEEVVAAVKRLKDEGYKKEDITLFTNSANAGGLKDSEDVDVATETTDTERTRTAESEDDRSLWTQIKDVFSSDTYDYESTSQDSNYSQDDDVLYPYKEDIKDGKTVIVVENYHEGSAPNADIEESNSRAQTAGTQGIVTGSGVNPAEPVNDEPAVDPASREKAAGTGENNFDDIDNRNDLTDDEKIRLKEERLEVDKEEVQTGEVDVRKETKHDTETVEVPVEREEVVVERKPVAGEDAKATDTDFDEDTESYKIPVKEEKVEVDKKPVVKEEVEIKKKRQEDVEEVTEDVRREELDVDSKGRTGAEGSENNSDRKNKR